MNLKIGTLSLTDGVKLKVTNFVAGSELATVDEVGTRIDLDFMGNSTTISETVASINRLLQQATQSQEDKSVDKVYLEADTGGGWWRSEIVSGVLDVGSSYYDLLSKGYPDASLLITRKNWWEGAEATLPISNVNSGVVYNCNDGSGTPPNKRVNVLRIASNAIGGDLQTPCKLTLNNTSEYPLGPLWIGVNNTRDGWGSISGEWTLEAESATGVTPVSDASASGGAYVKGTLNFGQSAAILTWNLSSVLINQLCGQRVKMLMRPHFTGAYSNFKYKVVIKHGTIKVFETDWVRESELTARHWLDLFDLRLPPWLEGESQLDTLVLELHATPTVAGAWQWAFDDILFLPQDSFVALTAHAPAENGAVVVDGDKGYVLDANNKKFGLRKMVGELILKPKVAHTFIFAMHSTYINQAPINMTLSVTGKYRPRRLTL